MKENQKLTTYLVCLIDYVSDCAPSVGRLTVIAPYGVRRGLGETEPKISSTGGETSCATIFFVVGGN